MATLLGCVATAMLASQVFRALQSEKEAEACSTLLACLHKCLQPNAQKAMYHDSVEICLTLQGLRISFHNPHHTCMRPLRHAFIMAMKPVHFMR